MIRSPGGKRGRMYDINELASERSERDTLRCNSIEISIYLASERSERDTIRSKLVMCSYSTEMASKLA